MNNRIDTQALQEAIKEHSDERLQKDLREWLAFAAPIEVQDIWKRYITKVEDQEIRNAKHVAFSAWVFVFFVIGIVSWSMWDMISLEHAVRNCVK
jgi:hypothetical protein